MLYNSFEFTLFLPVVFIIYWFVLKKSTSGQNILLLFASYLFYGWWDWRFLSLIIISSFVDFFIGKSIYFEKSKKKKKYLLFLSLIVNLGFLAFFKYFNFFIDSFTDFASFFGVSISRHTLNIILPVGISFYTFQTLSYTIDIYKGKLKPTNDIIAFFAFVAFFPQLVAGPIERAKSLLPQIANKRKFSYTQAADGVKQITWGFIKKMVIADNLAQNVNAIFDNYQSLDGNVLFLGILFFSFQIYCDFSGYSDIAIGTAKLFGIKLMTNFKLPYFSRNIGEFWSRWHISLSTWFRDYVYIPLGGNRVSKSKQIINSLTTFIISGFWHGANWTFVAWGALHGLYYIPSILLGKRKFKEVIASNRKLPSIKEFSRLLFTFLVVSISWVFFRSENIDSAISYLNGTFSLSLFGNPFNIEGANGELLIWIFLLVTIEWVQRKKEHVLQLSIKNNFLRYFVYALFIYVFISFANTGKQEFIYFAF